MVDQVILDKVRQQVFSVRQILPTDCTLRLPTHLENISEVDINYIAQKTHQPIRILEKRDDTVGDDGEASSEERRASEETRKLLLMYKTQRRMFGFGRLTKMETITNHRPDLLRVVQYVQALEFVAHLVRDKGFELQRVFDLLTETNVTAGGRDVAVFKYPNAMSRICEQNSGVAQDIATFGQGTRVRLNKSWSAHQRRIVRARSEWDARLRFAKRNRNADLFCRAAPPLTQAALAERNELLAAEIDWFLCNETERARVLEEHMTRTDIEDRWGHVPHSLHKMFRVRYVFAAGSTMCLDAFDYALEIIQARNRGNGGGAPNELDVMNTALGILRGTSKHVVDVYTIGMARMRYALLSGGRVSTETLQRLQHFSVPMRVLRGVTGLNVDGIEVGLNMYQNRRQQEAG